jgi:hypothetical protein
MFITGELDGNDDAGKEVYLVRATGWDAGAWNHVEMTFDFDKAASTFTVNGNSFAPNNAAIATVPVDHIDVKLGAFAASGEALVAYFDNYVVDLVKR